MDSHEVTVCVKVTVFGADDSAHAALATRGPKWFGQTFVSESDIAVPR